MGERKSSPIDELSPREVEVLALVAESWTNAEIAALLVVSDETVKTHVATILRKLDAADRREAARIYRASQQRTATRRDGAGRLLEIRPWHWRANQDERPAPWIMFPQLRRMFTGIATVLVAMYVLVWWQMAGGEEAPRSTPAVEAYASAAGPLPAEQAEALADGLVTLAEYEAGIGRFYTCASDGGMTPSPIPAAGLRPSTLSVIVPDADGVPDGETVNRYRAVLDACRWAAIEHLSVAWALQQREMDDETVERSLTYVEECLAERGIQRNYTAIGSLIYEVQFGVGTDADSAEFVRAYFHCQLRAEELTGYQLP